MAEPSMILERSKIDGGQFSYGAMEQSTTSLTGWSMALITSECVLTENIPFPRKIFVRKNRRDL